MKKHDALQIVEYLKNSQPEMIRFLEKLVHVESPSKNPESQVEIIRLLKKEFKKLNFFVFEMPGKKTGGYLYARPIHRKKLLPIQLLVGHCDTVWKKNTLLKMPVKIENERMSGPGVFDMKAGLTQMVYALKAIKNLHLKCLLTPVVLINSDEEIGSIESTNIIKNISKVADRAFILEPPYGLEGKLKTARKGVGRFSLIVKGVTAHAGLNPEQGASAIVELSYHIQQLFLLNDFKKGITVNVGTIEGGTAGNVIAAESKAVIDVRVKTSEDADFITQKILNLKPFHKDVELVVDGYFGRPPMRKTNRNKKLWKMAKNLGKLIDLNLEDTAVGGGSDGNTTSNFTATLDGLGTTGDGAHALHEFIFTEKLIERTALLTLLLTGNPFEISVN